MKCPHCGKQVQIPDNVYRNVDTYGQPALTRTDCCGKGVWLTQRRTYEVRFDDTFRPVDNWGKELKT